MNIAVWTQRRLFMQFSLVIALLAVSIGFVGCDLTSTAPVDYDTPEVIVQGHGLPTLHHLHWGSAYFVNPVWSPDGHWIAVMAGPGDAIMSAHVEVISPDGKTRYDLSNWGCGDLEQEPDYAWLPDGRLSCVTRETRRARMCIGAVPFISCTATYLSQAIVTLQRGFAWSPAGQFALLAGWPIGPRAYSDLYVLTPTGIVGQALAASDPYGAATPSFRPHAAELAYFRGVFWSETDQDAVFDLVVSSITEDAHGSFILGSARTLATDQHAGSSTYTWSPSGHWLAVTSGAGENDVIYLINADNPSQMVDVVLPDLTPHGMLHPIWSPDGKTLIVLSFGFDQPYSIDIASYLASKGLQP